MLLELDAGNTRIKWRIKHATQIVAAGADFAQALKTPDVFVAVTHVHFAAVNDHWPPSVQGFLGKVPAQRALTQVQTGSLVCAYADYARLGVDRWLAMLAAHSAAPNSGHVVVDAGTAITLDIVAPGGLHQGGYIVPGLDMQKTALLQNTRQISAPADWQLGTEPGQTTRQCVEHGILSMCHSWLGSIAQQYPAYQLWLTGGAAPLLQVNAAAQWQYAADLVLDGLTNYFELNR
jgi:type III pantothenate kinase